LEVDESKYDQIDVLAGELSAANEESIDRTSQVSSATSIISQEFLRSHQYGLIKESKESL
jgi:hypothetical protein